MSGWTTAADLKAQLCKRWDKGELLADRVAGGGLFPLRLVLRVPSSADLSARFGEVRQWIAALQGSGYRVVTRKVQTRLIAANELPAEAWVDTLDQAVALLGKKAELRAFDTLRAQTAAAEPVLSAWLQRHPMRALALAGQWPQLLALVAWVKAHPRPGIYLRQIDLTGIHSKFVEAQRGVIAELLDLALPPGAVDSSAAGATRFAQRYGFKDKPSRVRLRWLMPDDGWVSGGDGDFTVSGQTFARMAPRVRRVFVTENEINFLAFPALPDALVVFGAGYGFAPWAAAEWLARCELHYWGDIDTHGFAILDQLRAHHGHARSFLMDRETLLFHRAQWTEEPQPAQHDLSRLGAAERALYDDLRWRRLGDQAVRLEQERLGFGWVAGAVAALV